MCMNGLTSALTVDITRSYKHTRSGTANVPHSHTTRTFNYRQWVLVNELIMHARHAQILSLAIRYLIRLLLVGTFCKLQLRHV